MTESVRGVQYGAAFLLTAAVWPAICTCVLLLCCSAQAAWPPEKRQAYLEKQRQLRQSISRMLDIPGERVDLQPESRGHIERDGVVIEKWIFTSEPGSRVPCLLYRPKKPAGPVPAIVFTYGHGSSKSFWAYQYAGQLYAKLGFAALAIDPVGEEERNREGRRGTRAHDRKEADSRAAKAGRLMLGKLIFDTMRGVDFLLQHDDIDPQRIGVAGNSLGGSIAQFMAALDNRLRLTLVCGWMYDDYNGMMGKRCTRIPSQQVRKLCDWNEFLALSAPHCALLILNGDADTIIEHRHPVGKEAGIAWSGNRSAVAFARQVYEELGGDACHVAQWYDPGGGHRPYFLTKTALEWIHRHLGIPRRSLEEIRPLPTVNSGKWCDANSIRLERLYGTQLHQRGLTMVDMNIKALSDKELAVLRPGEKGDPQYTLAGWLDLIEKKRKQ